MPTRDRRIKQLRKRADASDEDAAAELARIQGEGASKQTDDDGQEPVSNFRVVEGSDKPKATDGSDDVELIDEESDGQKLLPGQEKKVNKKLLQYARDLKDKENARKSAQEAERAARELLLDYMHTNNVRDVTYSGLHIFIDQSEKAKVQVERDDD